MDNIFRLGFYESDKPTEIKEKLLADSKANFILWAPSENGKSVKDYTEEVKSQQRNSTKKGCLCVPLRAHQLG